MRHSTFDIIPIIALIENKNDNFRHYSHQKLSLLTYINLTRNNYFNYFKTYYTIDLIICTCNLVQFSNTIFILVVEID